MTRCSRHWSASMAVSDQCARSCSPALARLWMTRRPTVSRFTALRRMVPDGRHLHSDLMSPAQQRLEGMSWRQYGSLRGSWAIRDGSNWASAASLCGRVSAPESRLAHAERRLGLYVLRHNAAYGARNAFRE